MTDSWDDAPSAQVDPRSEWDRLKLEEVSGNHGRNWAQAKYKEMYNEWPPKDWGQPVRTHASDEEKAAEFERLRDIQKAKGLKEGFPSAAYKSQYGHWPPKEDKPKPQSQHVVTRSLAVGDTCPTCAQVVLKRSPATGNMDELPF